MDNTANPAINATFPTTIAGTVAVGTCKSGWFGLPQRQCQLDGTGAATVLRNPGSRTLRRRSPRARPSAPPPRVLT